MGLRSSVLIKDNDTADVGISHKSIYDRAIEAQQIILEDVKRMNLQIARDIQIKADKFIATFESKFDEAMQDYIKMTGDVSLNDANIFILNWYIYIVDCKEIYRKEYNSSISQTLQEMISYDCDYGWVEMFKAEVDSGISAIRYDLLNKLNEIIPAKYLIVKNCIQIEYRMTK